MKIIELRQNRLERLFCNWTRCHPVDADLHDMQAGIFQFREKLTSEEKTVRGQAGGKAEFATVANDFDNIRMQERLAADESDPDGAKVANFPYPFFQIVEARVRPAVVIFGAIGTIEIATIRDVKTALQRFTVDEALGRFQNVIAGKFAANVSDNLHAVWAEQTLSVATISSQRNKGCRNPLMRDQSIFCENFGAPERSIVPSRTIWA